jgi:transposase
MADTAACGGDAVYASWRAAVADAAVRVPADDEGAALFLRLARQLGVADNQPLPADGPARGGGARGLALRRSNRQSERQNPENGGTRGYDAGKKIKGRKRHILTDNCGYLFHAAVHTADIQDRDGAPLVLAAIINRFPWLRHVFADGGYAGDKLKDALAKIGKGTLEIIKQSDTAKGFELLPRRWVVERTFAWLNRNRRLAKDFEHMNGSSTAWLFLASVQLITRRIAKV